MRDWRRLWFEYGNLSRPPNLGDVLEGVALGEIDGEVQDAVGSYVGLGATLIAMRFPERREQESQWLPCS